MTAVVESKALLEKDFLNMELFNNLQQEVENGKEVHILAASDDVMWQLPEDFPEEVLLEVEVISSRDEEWPDRAAIDHDRCGAVDLDIVSCILGSSAPFSYGYESAVKHNSDLSHGSLDLSKTGPYAAQQLETTITTLSPSQNISSPPPTYITLHSNIPNESKSQENSPNGCLDLSRSTGSNYLHYSGGTSINLNQNLDAQNNTLIDLSTFGKYYQLPRIKLEPGLGIDPTITYKPETDYNHNESISSSIHNCCIETVVEYQEKTDEQMDDDYVDDCTCDNVSRVTVDSVKSSSIPLTVTSQDDDIDSGTESLDSKDSDSSLKLNIPGDEMNDDNVKVDRKRPGRKKGQVSKVYHLWEFIRDVLNDPKLGGTVIKWENEEEGIFRVVQSEVAAAMWGAKKNNRTKMTYEKMSRSIRYSRKEGYFDDLPKDKGYPKKLCFKFGQKAHGWNSKRRPLVRELPIFVNDQ